MNSTESCISPAEADNYSLFSSCSSIYLSRARFPWGRAISEQQCGFQAVTVLPLMAAGWLGFCLGLGDSWGWGLCCFSNFCFPLCGFPPLGQSCHWWPLCCLEMAFGLKPLWETQGPLWAVGHPPQACTWASSSVQPAHSQSFLEGLYPTERVGVEIAHRWEPTAGALTRLFFLLPWLTYIHSLPSFSSAM